MKHGIIASAVAGTLSALVMGLGTPATARADFVDDAAQVCRGYQTGTDWRVGADCNKTVGQSFQDNFAQIMSAGASYAEECVVEGCSASNEELREMHRMYREEMIYESGGSYHEMMEIGVGVWQRWTNNQDEAILILAMLGAFEFRGWEVRNGDIRGSTDRTW